MERFVLKIPHEKGNSQTLPPAPFGVFCLINAELRTKPGVTYSDYWRDCYILLEDDPSGVKQFSVYQNHGIRRKDISAALKESFNAVMPKVIELLPGMANPFKGRVELHSNTWILKEVHFLPIT